MKMAYNKLRIASCFLFIGMLFLHACSPVQLTSSWSDGNEQPVSFSRILVLSFAGDTAKRRLGEDHIKGELERHRQTAFTSLDIFGPGFAASDSLSRRQLLLDKGFDGVVTFRVLNVDDDYQPNSLFTLHPSFSLVEQDVYMSSELYRVKDKKMLWHGQSNSSSTDPTEYMAKRYARNIVRDMIHKRVLN
jgi:hypothetical protein